MATMTAVAWIGVMFLAAVVIRAKVKPIGNMLVPACLIGGIIGCILMNTVGLPGTTAAEYSTISGQMYTFMFINLGLTLPIPKDERTTLRGKGGIRGLRARMGRSMLSGVVGMGSYWAMAYAFQALVAFYLLKVIGGIWDMDPLYGLMAPFAFAQGPGQAITYGTTVEAAGWPNAIQVGITYAAIGFLAAFLVGVPFAKKGMREGIACSKTPVSDELKLGFFPAEKQESYGKITTYSGNLDVMTFHIALVGISWVLGQQVVARVFALIPGYFGELFPTLLFFNGMIAAYGVRFVLTKLGLTKYMDRGTQVRITNTCIDLMVLATFMAIDFQIVASWVLPILITSVAVCAVTWVTIRYFGSRFGGENDFERTLAEWGTVTGTNATGLALVRIVDPENETTTAAELGPSNAVNVPAFFVVNGILGYAAGAFGESGLWINLGGVLLAYLIVMKVLGCWGKKTFDINKGEKYVDGVCYWRDGKSIPEREQDT